MTLMKRQEAPAVRRRFPDLDDFRGRMQRMFDEPFVLPLYREALGFTPAVEISETASELLVKAELPGLRKEDVEIEIENNVLTLKGEKKEEREEKEEDTYLYERSYGSFQRSFSLPVGVKEDEVKADFRDGVLRIRLPKAQTARGKKIVIG
jgi:HSP20 family protein